MTRNIKSKHSSPQGYRHRDYDCQPVTARHNNARRGSFNNDCSAPLIIFWTYSTLRFMHRKTIQEVGVTTILSTWYLIHQSNVSDTMISRERRNRRISSWDDWKARWRDWKTRLETLKRQAAESDADRCVEVTCPHHCSFVTKLMLFTDLNLFLWGSPATAARWTHACIGTAGETVNCNSYYTYAPSCLPKLLISKNVRRVGPCAPKSRTRPKQAYERGEETARRKAARGSTWWEVHSQFYFFLWQFCAGIAPFSVQENILRGADVEMLWENMFLSQSPN